MATQMVNTFCCSWLYCILYGNNREHDKCPELLCSMVCRLKEEGLKFRLSVLGSHTNDIPGNS